MDKVSIGGQSLNKLQEIARKRYIWDFLSSHSCIDCRETDSIVLEFDHLSNKITNVADLRRDEELKALKEEIAKCVF